MSTLEINMKNRLSKLLAKGHFDQINEVFKAMEAKAELPEELQEKLSRIGNNPLEEPDLARKFEEGIAPLMLPFEFFTEEELSGMSQKETIDATLFSQLAIKKVMEYRDKNGNLKVTPSIEQMHYPTIVELKKFNKEEEALKELEEKLANIYQDIDNVSREKYEKMLELEEESKQLAKKIEENLLKLAKLPKNAIQWEKNLAYEILSQYIKGIVQGTPMGKQF